MTSATINLDDFEGPVLSGRQRGKDARTMTSVDALEGKNDVIYVKFPDSIKIITSSFFLGMFGPSITELGSKNAFKRKFQFAVDEETAEDFELYIELALQDTDLLAR